jgi:hypothetical protein
MLNKGNYSYSKNIFAWEKPEKLLLSSDITKNGKSQAVCSIELHVLKSYEFDWNLIRVDSYF